jgi:hypothetical protein
MMKFKTCSAALGLLALSTTIIPAYAECSKWSVGGPAGFANFRAQPDLNADVLWKVTSVGNGSEAGGMTWCGRSYRDARGIEWRWVKIQFKDEPWDHKAWVSSRVMIPYTDTFRSVSPPSPSFENGGE